MKIIANNPELGEIEFEPEKEKDLNNNNLELQEVEFTIHLKNGKNKRFKKLMTYSQLKNIIGDANV